MWPQLGPEWACNPGNMPLTLPSLANNSLTAEPNWLGFNSELLTLGSLLTHFSFFTKRKSRWGGSQEKDPEYRVYKQNQKSLRKTRITSGTPIFLVTVCSQECIVEFTVLHWPIWARKTISKLTRLLENRLSQFQMHDQEMTESSKGLECTMFSNDNSQMAQSYGVYVKNVSSGVKLPGFESKCCHLLWDFGKVI